MKIPYKTYLSEAQLPTAWMNLRHLVPHAPPILHPGTHAPVTLDLLSQVFVEELAKQELSDEKFISIPGEVLDFYRMIRPSPLVRAYALEKALDTPARIYYKFEGTNTSGSHKLNSAVPQAYYAKQQGLTSLTTETGAGQWGTALSMACAFYGIALDVYMVKISSAQKPYRKAVMETYGASVTPSPSNTTQAGRNALAENPDSKGSLGNAISEALEVAAGRENCRYVLGSVLQHVLLHQSVIGLEARAAMDSLEEYPDIVIGCAGGGSNLGGLIVTYAEDKIKGKASPRILAVEPASCPSLTRGTFAYDFGDVAKTTPLIKMYTLGSGFKPDANHAGGLRYHGMNTALSQLYEDGILEARAVPQRAVFDAAVLFARTEGTLPAPESAHAIRAAIDEALACKESGETKTILFGLSGTGYFDMAAYQDYLSGAMHDNIPTDETLARGFASLPKL
ncbi:MAG: TrpB-like pyridoxal phosphate-dependent enzyme [Oscillospiraceae bacterium]|jgi:tryptophan synthase beta chain|nr:TrpB-like pyridoxal phosphate-dependent enzyme [Oscillospiraceae bacterium]